MRWSNGDPIHALSLSVGQFALEGSFVESGWSAAVGESGSAIEIDLDAGEGRLDNDSLSIGEGSVELSPGNTTDWRRDVIYAAADSSYQVLTGAPGELSVDRDGETLSFANSPEPEPQDGDSLTGIPLWIVSIPPGAEDTSDLTNDHLHDVRPRLDAITPANGGGTDRTITIDATALDNGDHIQTALIVGTDETITITEWGATQIHSDGTHDDPETGIRVALVNPNGDTVQSESTGLGRDDDGIVTESPGGSGPHHYALRVENDSGTDLSADNGEGVMGQFVVVVD